MMSPVEPRINGRKVRVAEDQPEYQALTIVQATNQQYRGQSNTVIMAFEPTPAERQLIINGAMIYVALLTFGGPQQPILISADVEEMAQLHGLAVEDRRTALHERRMNDWVDHMVGRDVPETLPTESEGPE